VTLRICEKRQSVLEATRHCLVMGGPGSGKTTLALLKAVARIDQRMAPGQAVLFLSFSRAAVVRIADTAKEHIPADKQAALSIQTFHSFFWQILQGHAYLLGSPRHLSILLAHDEEAMREGIAPGDPGWADWETERRRMFNEEGRVCFDLFAPLTAELLIRAKRIRDRMASRYPLILVDEAQDTGNEQWECMRLLAEKSQVICLADPNQMIYDFLPGVGPARIGHIRKALNPLEVDLETENNRSPGTEIAVFAHDVLVGHVRGAPYKGISRYRFKSDAPSRDKAIRCSIGVLSKRLAEDTGRQPESIAVVASYGSGVVVISSALQRDRPIPHQILFDQAFTLLSSRAAAFLLEPRDASTHAEDAATLLEIAGAAFRAKGSKTARQLAGKLASYAGCCRTGTLPKVKVVRAANDLIASARARRFTGNPRTDWLSVKQDLRQLGEKAFRDMASSLDYLVAFSQGHRISENLSALWIQHGAYPGAREALDGALAQEQLLSGREQLHGIHVMNMHKCKGKQFDGVVLYRQQYHSPFVWREEVAPYTSSRRLLHMAITRAKSHVLILDEAYSNCPILDQHKL
jgi:DNA helicase II / ATP-dependent DNA helicase PcrA